MFNRYPNLSRFAVFVFLPILLVISYGYWQVGQSAPKYQGNLTVSGITDKVEVVFNDAGIPTVTGAADADVYFAQGYLHAQERLWQMELQRRVMSGRLSEIFGRSMVTSDTSMRTLGLAKKAQSAWQNLPNNTQAVLQSYSAGVNAYIKQAQVLPPEFLYFNIEPTPWQPVDSILWQKGLALNLSLNMYEEINRFAALKAFNFEQLKSFYPYDDDYNDEPLVSNKGQFLANNINAQDYQQQAQAMQDIGIGGRYVGSNTFAVAGHLTKTGKPMLLNDPHLSIQYPSLWYAINLKGNKLSVSGMSLVGLPGVIFGRNDYIAWGGASLMSDQQDLFILDKPLGREDVYLTDQGTQSIDCETQVIEIAMPRPKLLNNPIKPRSIEICETALGPVVSANMAANSPEMALRWAALDDSDNSVGAFIDVQYAKNIEQFRGALKNLKSPALHFAYADVEGNIALQVAGHIPQRGKGSGMLPNLANQTQNYWQGYVPFEQLPFSYNPKSGYLIAANNQVERAGNVTISHEWASDARKNRIAELISQDSENTKQLQLSDMLAMQSDQLDVGARDLMALLGNDKIGQLIEAKSNDKDKQWLMSAFDEVKAWQGQYDKQSAAASIYFYWLEALKGQVYAIANQGAAGEQIGLLQTLRDRAEEPQLIKALKGQDIQWCQKAANAFVACQTQVVDAFIAGMKRLKRDTRSTDTDDWHWGELHHVSYTHQPFGYVKGLELKFKTRLSVGGSQNTVNAANAVKDPDGGWAQYFGTAFRMGFDLSQDGQSKVVMPGGQSGHPFSQHFDDMFEAFDEGGFFSFAALPNQSTSLVFNPKEH